MANHLVRITDNDYRDFRRSYSKITYSMNKRGEPAQVSEDEVRDVSNNFLNGIIGKGDFLEIMAQPEKYELYFFKNDVEEIIGVLSLVFSDKSCYIAEFAVFDRGKGLGTELYTLALEKMRPHNTRLIELSAPPPFAGSREFWKKLGFTLKYKSNSVFEKPIRFRYQK